MSNRLRAIGVIPARLNSTRLPRKVLRLICGKPMVQHVYERARGCDRLDQLLVATDSDEVLQACRARGIPAELTSADHVSGTDRVCEIMQRHAADVFVNIQGDEPLLDRAHIDALLEPFDRDPVIGVSTLRTPLDAADAGNPSHVKVVSDVRGNALYFSRWPIPYDRDRQQPIRYFKHLGLYAYRRDALALFHRLPPSTLELAERLEQLRLLEHGVAIREVDAPCATISVDTEDDLQLAERALLRSAA